MKEVTYKRSDLNVTVTEVTLDELSDRIDEIRSWDGRLAADMVYVEYADGSAYYYDGQSGEGDLRGDGIVCALIVDDVDVYVYGDYYVDAYGEVNVFDARLSLEAFAEACADSQTELDMVLADIAEDFAGRQTYAEAFINAVQREMADWSGHMVLHDAADEVIGNVIARAKKRSLITDRKSAMLDGLASVIVNNSGIECDEDDLPVFPDVVSVSVGNGSISVTMRDGSVHEVTVS